MTKLNNKILINLGFVFVLSLIFFYFNATPRDPEYLGCTSGEVGSGVTGNGGDGGSVNYRVCPGEDFWLPNTVKDSSEGMVGTWFPPLKEVSGTIIENEFLNTSVSNYTHMKWYFDDSSTYPQDFTPPDRFNREIERDSEGNIIVDSEEPCFNKSYATYDKREEIYAYTQLNCIEVCERARSEGLWSGDCMIEYNPAAPGDYSGYTDLNEHFELGYSTEIQDSYPDCRGYYVRYQETSNVNDGVGAPNSIFQYTKNISGSQRFLYCNQDFKNTEYFKKNSLKLMIHLGKGGVINGGLPESCKNEIGTFNNYTGVRWSEATDPAGEISNSAEKDPDWSKLEEIKACVKEHYTNIFRSIDSFGMRDQIYSIDFTEEGGYTWTFYFLADLTGSANPLEARDNLQENFIESVAEAINEYVDADTTVGATEKSARKTQWKNKFYTNFYGGRAFKAKVETALNNEMGIGDHGLPTSYNHAILQHLPQLTYNQNNKRYDLDRSKIPPIMHTDVEGLHKADDRLVTLPRTSLNTWGTYRIYLNSLLKDLAYGFNSITNTSQLIPSKDLYARKNCGSITNIDSESDNCNFDYQQIGGEYIDGDGAYALYNWSKKMVSRPPNATPEAYCIFSQNGNEIPKIGGNVSVGSYSMTKPELLFQDFNIINKGKWHWGQLKANPRYDTYIPIPSFSYTNQLTDIISDAYFDFENTFQNYIHAPIVKSTGMHCKTVQLPPGLSRYNATDLPGGRKLDEDFVGLVTPNFNNKLYFGYPNPSPNYFFEATKLKALSSSKKAHIILDFDNTFATTALTPGGRNKQWVLKLSMSTSKEFCSSPRSATVLGSFYLKYRNYSNALVTKKITIDTSQVDVCENRTFYLGGTDSKTSLLPKIFTVTVPFHSYERAQQFDPTKGVATYKSNSGSFLSLTGLNDNLVIEQDPESGFEIEMMMVRLIDKSFAEN